MAILTGVNAKWPPESRPKITEFKLYVHLHKQLPGTGKNNIKKKRRDSGAMKQQEHHYFIHLAILLN
jgi:hypothetical protein